MKDQCQMQDEYCIFSLQRECSRKEIYEAAGFAPAFEEGLVMSLAAAFRTECFA
ncbi:hypothetical protein NSS70_04900 [Aeribacillus sp. FSL K6-2848]|jgi:hypothetical protein|uniref:hypothetical protein n=1 Tax=Aeribacillus sp. FSL K6-2848 TaxID=2954612 RepID=UPI000AAC83A2